MRTPALLVMMVVLSGCAGERLGTPAPPEVRRVEFDGEIWSRRMSAAAVLFQDGAQSIPCEGGTVWLFGDTFTGLPTPADSDVPPAKELGPNYTGMLGATIAFLPTSVARETRKPRLEYFTQIGGTAANPLELLPGESKDLHRMWPLGGVTLGGRVYVYYAMIEKTDGQAPWNFKGIGGGLAWSATPLGTYTRLTPGGSWRFPVEPFQVVRVGEMLYLYQVRGEPPLKGASLARVPATSIEQPAAYEWFGGMDALGRPRWSPEAAEAAVVLPEAAGQFSAAWNAALGCWLGVTSSDFFHPREIQFRTAKEPWGPWSAPTRVAMQEKKGKTTDLIYCACIHPELSSPDGSEVVVTFCRMLKGDWELSNPEMMRVRVGGTTK